MAVDDEPFTITNGVLTLSCYRWRFFGKTARWWHGCNQSHLLTPLSKIFKGV